MIFYLVVLDRYSNRYVRRAYDWNARPATMCWCDAEVVARPLPCTAYLSTRRNQI